MSDLFFSKLLFYLFFVCIFFFTDSYHACVMYQQQRVTKYIFPRALDVENKGHHHSSLGSRSVPSLGEGLSMPPPS